MIKKNRNFFKFKQVGYIAAFFTALSFYPAQALNLKKDFVRENIKGKRPLLRRRIHRIANLPTYVFFRCVLYK